MNNLIYKLQSIAGLLIILGICYLISEKRKSIKIRIVLWGLGLQFVFALFILKTKPGFLIFEKINLIINKVLSFSNAGAKFLFGSLVESTNIGAIVAFQVLPIIIFISALMGILYYFGIIQFFVRIMAKIMHRSMKISGAESLGSAMLIFMGIESSAALQEYIKKMTRSEIFCYMSAFMSTIATSVMAAYVSFGASAGHLLAASIMSAPAAVAIAKILIPETEKCETAGDVKFRTEKKEKNIIEAAANGASTGSRLAIQIGAMLIAFVGIIYLLDGLLGYIGRPLNLAFSLEKLFGYLFYPFALLLGVPFDEAYTVGQLLGTKTVFNEFLAYIKLQPLIQNGTLSPRSIIISTYALCGFTSFCRVAI